MIRYEFELVLASGRIDMNKLPDTPIITSVIKDKEGQDCLMLELSSLKDLSILSMLAMDGYFGCKRRIRPYDVVVSFSEGIVYIYDDLLE